MINDNCSKHISPHLKEINAVVEVATPEDEIVLFHYSSARKADASCDFTVVGITGNKHSLQTKSIMRDQGGRILAKVLWKQRGIRQTAGRIREERTVDQGTVLSAIPFPKLWHWIVLEMTVTVNVATVIGSNSVYSDWITM